MATSNFDIILGNSNARFSGVTSTMLQTMEIQKELTGLRVLGEHHITQTQYVISFRQLIRICRKTTSENKHRVFHARRNDEMIQALILKHLFRAKIKICFTSTAQRKHSQFTKFLIRQMDGVISTCQEAAQYLDKPPDIIIPHGVDTETWTPSNNKENILSELGLPGKYAIGIFGRVRKQKGIDLFVEACIQALPSNPDFCAIIVGATAEKDQIFAEELKSKINQHELNERIKFLGEQDFNQLPKLFSAMHLVCALSHNEGFGLTVLEAMASGCAVLATDAGAWKSIVDQGETGHVVRAGHQNEITHALCELLQSPETLERMGDAGRQKALKEYKIQTEAERLCTYYRSLQDDSTYSVT